jgi:hypothetical protein
MTELGFQKARQLYSWSQKTQALPCNILFLLKEKVQTPQHLHASTTCKMINSRAQGNWGNRRKVLHYGSNPQRLFLLPLPYHHALSITKLNK